MKKSVLLTFILAIALLSGLIYILNIQNPKFELIPLLLGNVFLALISILSYRIITQGIKSDNANAFVRSKYSGTLLKFFSCIVLLGVYIVLNRDDIYKPTIFLFVGMYIVYAVLEAAMLSKIAKKGY